MHVCTLSLVSHTPSVASKDFAPVGHLPPALTFRTRATSVPYLRVILRSAASVTAERRRAVGVIAARRTRNVATASPRQALAAVEGVEAAEEARLTYRGPTLWTWLPVVAKWLVGAPAAACVRLCCVVCVWTMWVCAACAYVRACVLCCLCQCPRVSAYLCSSVSVVSSFPRSHTFTCCRSDKCEHVVQLLSRLFEELADATGRTPDVSARGTESVAIVKRANERLRRA